MNTGYRRLPSVVAAILLGATVSSQQPPPPQQDQPVFRSGINLIEVDVRVFDGDGRFVADLKPEHFELLEAGAAQQIQRLYLVEGSTAEAKTVSGQPSEGGAAPAADAPAPARQTWIFIFDVNHLMPGAGFDRARKAVEDFIAARFRDGDLGGILAGDRMVNNRLTSVREELAAAVRSVKPSAEARTRQLELTRQPPRILDELEAIQIANNDSEALRRAVTRACAEDPTTCGRADLEIAEKARRLRGEFERATVRTLTSLNALASGLARVPGPKTLVFLSDGFVTERMETSLQQIVGQLARAGARLYGIDVRGLNRGAGTGSLDQVAVEDTAGAVAQFDMQADGPNSLAVDTGGRMIRNENNIGRALDQIADDAGRYYVLAYQSSNPAFDGRFRPIEVKVRRAGVRVRARRGYLALEPARILVPRPVSTPPPRKDEDVEVAEDPTAPPLRETVPGLPPALPGMAAGVVVGGASATTGLRMRPGAAEHVKAISGGSTGAPDDVGALGWKAYERGDVETAADLLAKAAAGPDARPWVFYTLGLSQFALGRPLDAVVSWERVRQAEPDFDAVYLDLADAYLQGSEVTRALEVLRDGSRRWPSNPEFHNAIGVIHVRRGALDEGIAAFALAAESDPEAPLAYFNLGRAYEMRFARSHRYIRTEGRWMASGSDRRKAAENYERCIRLGGPYVQAATEGLHRLEWSR